MKQIMKFGWFLVACVLVSAGKELAADGGYWRITGDLVNVDNNGVLGADRCEMANVRLRFKSRWSGGTAIGLNGPLTPFPWGPSWGEAITGADGHFSETSYFFHDVSRSRDILVEIQLLGRWQQLTIINGLSGATPHQANGNLLTFDQGEVETGAFDCTTVFGPAPEDETADPPSPIAQISPVPCGFGPKGKSGIDLAFTSVVVRHRDNEPNAPQERISWEVVIRNLGTVAYSGSGACRTKVRLSIYLPELSNPEREYFLTLGQPIPAGGSRTFTSNSGNLGETTEKSSVSYNVLFEIDPEQKVMEFNETNNFQAGCYTPGSGAYNDGPCKDSAKKRSPPKKGPPPKNLSKKRRLKR